MYYYKENRKKKKTTKHYIKIPYLYLRYNCLISPPNPMGGPICCILEIFSTFTQAPGGTPSVGDIIPILCHDCGQAARFPVPPRNGEVKTTKAAGMSPDLQIPKRVFMCRLDSKCWKVSYILYQEEKMVLKSLSVS